MAPTGISVRSYIPSRGTLTAACNLPQACRLFPLVDIVYTFYRARGWLSSVMICCGFLSAVAIAAGCLMIAH